MDVNFEMINGYNVAKVFLTHCAPMFHSWNMYLCPSGFETIIKLMSLKPFKLLLLIFDKSVFFFHF